MIASNNGTTGVYNVSGNNPLPATPVSNFPVFQAQSFLNNNGKNLINFDPHLETPYVLEWSFGIQRELWSN